MNKIEKIICGMIFILMLVLAGCDLYNNYESEDQSNTQIEMQHFDSCEAVVDVFEETRAQRNSILYEVADMATGSMKMTMSDRAAAPEAYDGSADYSKTNVQVEGVDEADIIKTDGKYIYTLSRNNLVIAKAYPADEAKILYNERLNEFYPSEMFIYEDKLAVFGRTKYYSDGYDKEEEMRRVTSSKIVSPHRYMNLMEVRIYDISDRSDPQYLKSYEVEGNYVSSRMIGSDIYFVANAYPHWDNPEEIIPLYRETQPGNVQIDEEAAIVTIRYTNDESEFKPISQCSQVGYFEPYADNFVIAASFSLDNTEQPLNKEIITGRGQNIYSSTNNLYIAETSYQPRSLIREITGDKDRPHESTSIHRFALSNGKIKYEASGDVPGHILNQFSMDEYENFFRIATTIGHVSRSGSSSTNNVYVLDEDLDTVGKLEDLAPGEKIYSVRFMGKRGYVVTFKKVDPLFVIDLATPYNPTVLGKLKIPGYSDYLHPYDETHLIGLGKDTVEAEEGDFAWYQGIKMAIFDVSDVEHPKELHKVIIGDRGTDSLALHDHKAFLFDRARELLIIPVRVAELSQEQKSKEYRPGNEYGDFTFQGAYVFNLNLKDGFDLRGRVSHYDDSIYKKSGYYFRGDASIKRSLFIEDILYTLSDKYIQLINLETLERIKVLEI